MDNKTRLWFFQVFVSSGWQCVCPFPEIFVATLQSGTMLRDFVVVFHSHTMYLIETNDIIVGRFVHITGVVKVITSRYEYKPTRH